MLDPTGRNPENNGLTLDIFPNLVSFIPLNLPLSTPILQMNSTLFLNHRFSFYILTCTYQQQGSQGAWSSHAYGFYLLRVVGLLGNGGGYGPSKGSTCSRLQAPGKALWECWSSVSESFDFFFRKSNNPELYVKLT